MDVSVTNFLAHAEKLKYKVYTGRFNLNIVGWRSPELVPNKFGCKLSVYYYDTSSGEWYTHTFPITTYPGTPFLRNPIHKKGAAILVPDQYRNSYKIGLFRGYEALLQYAPVTVYRDNNKDDIIDQGVIDTGMFGIHIHRAGLFSKYVGLASAGCQVFQKRDDFDVFMSLCRMQVRSGYGTVFTYTLLG